MRQFLTLAFAVSIGLASIGPASAQSRSFQLVGFQQVDIANGLSAIVTMDDAFSVHAASGNQQALDKLEITVRNGTLSARLEQDFFDFLKSGGLLGDFFGGDNAVTIQITLPVLTGANASSGADIEIQAPTGQLAIDVSSGGNIRVAAAQLRTVNVNVSSGAGAALDGTCSMAILNASSGSDIKADALLCRAADANASSGGDISISALDSIKANASSGGDINVSGNPPKSTVNSSSGGDVRLNE